jgi:hypothetical protein
MHKMNRVHMLRRLHILSPASRDFGQYGQYGFLVFLRDDLRVGS